MLLADHPEVIVLSESVGGENTDACLRKCAGAMLTVIRQRESSSSIFLIA
jgi:hypothetical protein